MVTRPLDRAPRRSPTAGVSVASSLRSTHEAGGGPCVACLVAAGDHPDLVSSWDLRLNGCG
jgi:hypothetical protein